MTALNSCALFPITNLSFSLYPAKRLGHYWGMPSLKSYLMTRMPRRWLGSLIGVWLTSRGWDFCIPEPQTTDRNLWLLDPLRGRSVFPSFLPNLIVQQTSPMLNCSTNSFDNTYPKELRSKILMTNKYEISGDS